ncbi:response regulator [Vibrio sp. Isolate25]|uniref:response regulator n=1 Tax=Vibrio sp. Isolate25 TaxID=2908535 RepID=UPI001EFE40EF|nr:response regulator [Vibrio sp. Isolate25]MCG9595553.1 response regulator [Vibrio sp. Isolate25]
MFGQIQNISQAGVLIADDSPLVVTNLRILLRELGFSDRLIFTAKDVRSVYQTLREISIDLFICDYRFGKELNGKQIYEECCHYGLIRSECAFVMLTSETTGNVARSILEAEPDEYILKPYSIYDFKKRILRAYKQKQILSSLLRSTKKASFKEIEHSFNKAREQYPEYSTSFVRAQGAVYLREQYTEQAFSLFQACQLKCTSHWAIVGCAMALVMEGKEIKAQVLLQQWMDETGKKPSAVLDVQALCCLLQKDREGAQQALLQAIKFSKGSASRLLAYIHLCEMEENYQSVMSHLAVYRDQIVNTHRNTVVNATHVLRLKLLTAKAQGRSISMSAHHELSNIMKADLSDHDALALTLVDVHIELHDKNYKIARIKLANLLKNYQKLDLPLLDYLLFLLYETDNYYWFDKVTHHVRSHRSGSTPLLGEASLQLLIENRIERGRKRKSDLVRLLCQVDKYAVQSVDKAIALCLEVFKSRLQCVEVASKLLSLLSREIPAKVSPTDVRKAIFDCEAAISHTSSLRRSERIEAQKKLNLVKHKFNRSLAAVTM